MIGLRLHQATIVGPVGRGRRKKRSSGLKEHDEEEDEGNPPTCDLATQP